ncbi:UNVERIFIED_CONTAM: Regulator of chromosome condensation, partial [Siphonaria sp. JEL0065]
MNPNVHEISTAALVAHHLRSLYAVSQLEMQIAALRENCCDDINKDFTATFEKLFILSERLSGSTTLIQGNNEEDAIVVLELEAKVTNEDSDVEVKSPMRPDPEKDIDADERFSIEAEVAGQESDGVIVISKFDSAFSLGEEVGEFPKLSTTSTSIGQVFILEDGHSIPTCIKFFNDKNIVAIASGTCPSLALSQNGIVYFWYSYELRFPPVMVAELKGLNVVQVACCDSACAVLTEDGHVYVWGYLNDKEPFTHPKAYDNEKPTRVEELERVVSIKAGSDHFCALSDSGIVYTWGSNQFYQLGREVPSEERMIPAPMELLALKVVDIYCTAFQTCVVDASGSMFAVGNNSHRQLSVGERFSRTHLPRCSLKIRSDDTRVISVAGSATHRVTLYANGRVSTNEEKQPGIKANIQSVCRPQHISLLRNVEQVYAKGCKTVAVEKGKSGGRLWLWGVSKKPGPRRVDVGRSVIAAECGDNSTLLLLAPQRAPRPSLVRKIANAWS